MHDRGTQFFFACLASAALVLAGIFFGDRLAHTVGSLTAPGSNLSQTSLVVSASVKVKMPNLLSAEGTIVPKRDTSEPPTPSQGPYSQLSLQPIEEPMITQHRQAESAGFKPISVSSSQNWIQATCTDGSYTAGQWIRNTSIVNLPYVSKGILSVCLDEFKRNAIPTRKKRAKNQQSLEDEVPSVPRPVQYQWRPHEPCRLVPWSRETFCRALAGRSILIAGDSLNDHWHASLLWLLGSDFDVYRREGSNWGKINCYGHPICEEYWRPLRSAPSGREGIQALDPAPLVGVDPSTIPINRTSMRGPLLRFATNQLLRNVSFQHKKATRNQEWWKELPGADIVILNAGSWMVDPADKSHAVSEVEYEDIMHAAVRVLRNASFNGSVIWRTTYSGHPNCWKYQEPLRAELTNDELSQDPKYRSYGWSRIRRRNDIATRIWKAAGAHILDVAPITNLMPLGHLAKNHPDFATKGTTDCLHYCSPGPVYDTWSFLLMNMLLGNLT